MNLDEFEQHLARQPLRPLPPEWRAEILGAATAAAAVSTEAEPRRSAPWWREWLWPTPVAWGALATCWAAILVLNRLALPSAAQVAETRANARLALAYQALLRDYHTVEPATSVRSPAPTATPPPRRPQQGQAWPNASATLASYDRTQISPTPAVA